MKTILAMAALCTVAAGANAGSISCGGTVTYVGYHSANTFMIQLSSMNTAVFFCNPETTFSVVGTSYTTGPNTCKAMIAMFLTAKANGTEIPALYFDGDDVPATCNTWGAWRSANVRHFAL